MLDCIEGMPIPNPFSIKITKALLESQHWLFLRKNKSYLFSKTSKANVIQVPASWSL